jgi:hypothetical protein
MRSRTRTPLDALFEVRSGGEFVEVQGVALVSAELTKLDALGARSVRGGEGGHRSAGEQEQGYDFLKFHDGILS